MAHILLFSSLVCSTHKREKAKRNEGVNVLAEHTGLAAFITANLMICGFTFCSSPDLGNSTWDRQNAV